MKIFGHRNQGTPGMQKYEGLYALTSRGSAESQLFLSSQSTLCLITLAWGLSCHFQQKLTWMITDWEAYLLQHFDCRSRKDVLSGNIYMKLRQVCSSFFPSKIIGFPCRMAETSFWGCMANSQKDRCMRDANALFTGALESTFEVAMCPVTRSKLWCLDKWKPEDFIFCFANLLHIVFWITSHSSACDLMRFLHRLESQQLSQTLPDDYMFNIPYDSLWLMASKGEIKMSKQGAKADVPLEEDLNMLSPCA